MWFLAKSPKNASLIQTLYQLNKKNMRCLLTIFWFDEISFTMRCAQKRRISFRYFVLWMRTGIFYNNFGAWGEKTLGCFSLDRCSLGCSFTRVYTDRDRSTLFLERMTLFWCWEENQVSGWRVTHHWLTEPFQHLILLSNTCLKLLP